MAYIYSQYTRNKIQASSDIHHFHEQITYIMNITDHSGRRK